jgi:predicted hydrocarbon binding protein
MSEKQIGLGLFQLSEDGHILGFDRRWILFSTSVFAGILDRFNDIIGPVARRQMYEIGYESGKLAGEKVKPFFGCVIEQYRKHINMINAMGWGTSSKIEYDEKTGRIDLDYPDSWQAHGYKELHPDKQTKSPICFISAGLAAGAAEGAFGIPYEGEEIKCISKGDHACSIVLTPMGKKKKIIK